MPNLIKKVQNTIFQHNLFPRGSKIIIACSGGPDSTALLDILSKLKKKYVLELAIAHVNYNLRGHDSQKDEDFVRKLVLKHKLVLKVLRPASSSHNSENKLREIRYDFFEKTRKELGFDYIIVGHTLDDQVETFLMRVIRGSGLAGLSSISYKNNRIIRPLLNMPKDEIIKYLKNSKLSYRIDKTNLESEYLRNKIRNRLIPYLEKNFNSGIKKTIFDATESIREDFDLIYQISKKEIQKNKGLSAKRLLTLHPSLQKQILLNAILEKKGNLKDVESAHIGELLKIIKSTKNKSQVVLFEGLKVTRKGDKLIIENN
jgi:tRNA(Ile)-lysidine synthase